MCSLALSSLNRMNYSMSPSFMFYNSERRKLKSSTFNSKPASFLQQFPWKDFKLFTVGGHSFKGRKNVHFHINLLFQWRVRYSIFHKGDYCSRLRRVVIVHILLEKIILYWKNGGILFSHHWSVYLNLLDMHTYNG